MAKRLRLLIVEDEDSILDGLIDVFIFHGYEVDFAKNGTEGLHKALRGNYDLIILDVMLPERDGYSLCEEIRKSNREQPILMLTAKSSDEDVIQGLSLGADDYVAKPFSIRQLVLRVEAILRRSGRVREEAEKFTVGDWEIDTRMLIGRALNPKKSAAIELQFTRKEIELLLYLKRNLKRPVPRGELLSEVWGYARSQSYDTRTVDIHVAKIRSKIESNPKQPSVLLTVRGEGYLLTGVPT